MDRRKVNAFRRGVWSYYKTHGRHMLPWRKTTNPYRILVSEIMLQQTQVERVIPYYRAWVKKFPSVKVLAKVPLGEVLRAWQGLGYNRRAKMLHETAKRIVSEYGGVFPKTPELLEKLPGIGPYTARAVCAFAYNQDVVFIETNIRTVFTHYFFKNAKDIADKDVLVVIEEALLLGRAREWYAGLMDYGAHLKKTGVRLNSRAKGYVPQKKFAGSAREARGAILTALAQSSEDKKTIEHMLGGKRVAQVRIQLSALVKEGLVEEVEGMFQLPQ